MWTCPRNASTTTRGVVAANGHAVRHRSGRGATAWLTGRIGLRTAATYYKVLGPPSNFHGAPGSGLVYTNVLRDFSLTRLTVGIDIRLSGSKRADHNEPSRIDPGAAR
jgi:hypothetical protein